MKLYAKIFIMLFPLIASCKKEWVAGTINWEESKFQYIPKDINKTKFLVLLYRDSNVTDCPSSIRSGKVADKSIRSYFKNCVNDFEFVEVSDSSKYSAKDFRYVLASSCVEYDYKMWHLLPVFYDRISGQYYKPIYIFEFTPDVQLFDRKKEWKFE